MPQPLRSITSVQVLVILVAILIWKVTVSIVWEYRSYVPPNFESDFLLGRESYFWNGYHWAFYVHLLAGPPSLMLGTVLVSQRLRRRSFAWHRRLGRVQVALVLLLIAPSGLWMACYGPANEFVPRFEEGVGSRFRAEGLLSGESLPENDSRPRSRYVPPNRIRHLLSFRSYAASEAVAGVGLGLLAIATATCAWCGWRAAVARRLEAHRRWMWRMFLLLCSAVVLRILGGLATVLPWDSAWLYAASIWTSWLVPLLVFEISSSSSSLVRKRTLPSNIAP